MNVELFLRDYKDELDGIKLSRVWKKIWKLLKYKKYLLVLYIIEILMVSIIYYNYIKSIKLFDGIIIMTVILISELTIFLCINNTKRNKEILKKYAKRTFEKREKILLNLFEKEEYKVLKNNPNAQKKLKTDIEELKRKDNPFSFLGAPIKKLVKILIGSELIFKVLSKILDKYETSIISFILFFYIIFWLINYLYSIVVFWKYDFLIQDLDRIIDY